MLMKKKVYLTTLVFKQIVDHPKVSEINKKRINELWETLGSVTELKVANKRFPDKEEINQAVNGWGAQIIGCHLSHEIPEEVVKNTNLVAVCTATAGYNHITSMPGMLITHTPHILHKTVADFTIALILSNLRNIVNLHNFVWEGNWGSNQKWDMDENLSSTMDEKILGIVGMGDIGQELAKKISPWGVKIVYYDINQKKNFEKEFTNVTYMSSMEDVFSQADIISLHIPLNSKTKHIVNRVMLKKMKEGALLVNTARGSVINFSDLIEMLENNEISINLAFDVFEQEPIENSLLKRFKKILKSKPELRFTFIPHSASSSADTRAQMVIFLLKDIIKIATSQNNKDLAGLRLIPEQKYLLEEFNEQTPKIKTYRIAQLWH
jgi:lactate dehydrogenase-like 2-hydroxyacid dehydrogenase